MADGDNKHQQLVIFDLAENPIISNPVAPQPGQICPESLAESTRIGVPCDPLIEIGQNLTPGLVAELLKVLQSPFVEPINPVHVSLRRRNRFWTDFSTDW